MIYPFVCEDCNSEFEIKLSLKEYENKRNNLTCEKCSGILKRVFIPVGVSFGPGFFKDGYESAKNVRRSKE